MRGHRPPRRGEAGFTLIEVIVSIAILMIIGGVIGVVFAAGLRTLSPTGPQPRLLAAHDLMIIEQTLGRDGARATCIKVPPSGAVYPNPGCSNPNGFTNAPCPSTALCFGWIQWTNPSMATCEVAVYTTSGTITRTEYAISSSGAATAVASVALAPVQAATLSIVAVQTNHPAGQTYTWVSSLAIGIATFTSGPTQQLTLQPVATDPAGTTAQLNGANTAC